MIDITGILHCGTSNYPPNNEIYKIFLIITASYIFLHKLFERHRVVCGQWQ